MPNLFRHLIESRSYETLNQVQGDKIVIATKSLGGEEWMRGIWLLDNWNLFGAWNLVLGI